MQDPTKLTSIDLKTEIHPTAIVNPWAKVGAGVKIGPYSIIGEHVELGDGCVVGPRVLIEGRTTIGKNNEFFHGATIGTPAQDLKCEGDVAYVEIGDGNIFREFCTVNRATDRGGKTKVGSDCFIMAYAHVAHNCVLADHVVMANSVHLAGHVTLDQYAIIGGGTVVHQFVRVGQHAIIGGGCRVTQDIPPYVKAAGSPARAFGVNTVGLERRGFPAEKRAAIKRMYTVLYRRRLNVTQALAHLRNGTFGDPERRILVDFLESSQRGIAG
ncbi:MAG: acyl-ACP--UDP-N-acetylglucosamine O-acyltransferase [Candidatus Krumholzibacteriia bacterium]